jgi:hypothetical protein
MIDKASNEALAQATEQVETKISEENKLKDIKEKKESEQKFELEKIRVKTEADAKIKYEVEMKHKEDFETKMMA